jgi:hypothetical protein
MAWCLVEQRDSFTFTFICSVSEKLRYVKCTCGPARAVRQFAQGSSENEADGDKQQGGQ